MSSYSRKRKRTSGSSYRTSRKRGVYVVPNRLRYSRAPLATRGYKFPSTELKFLDTASTGGIAFGNQSTGATGAVSIVLINASVPGTGATNRIGRKIIMKNILMRCYYDAGTNSNSGYVRTMLVYDMQANGATPSAADIFMNGSTPFITMPMNLDNRDRFRVIHDRTRYLAGANGNTDTNEIYYKKYIKLGKGLETIYNAGSAGTVADIQTGALYLVVMTCNDTANVNARVETRIRFVDN